MKYHSHEGAKLSFICPLLTYALFLITSNVLTCITECSWGQQALWNKLENKITEELTKKPSLGLIQWPEMWLQIFPLTSVSTGSNTLLIKFSMVVSKSAPIILHMQLLLCAKTCICTQKSDSSISYASSIHK